jgi:hypothetical protein
MNMKKISAIIAVLVFAVVVTGFANEAAKPAAAATVASKATATAPVSVVTTTAAAPAKH